MIRPTAASWAGLTALWRRQTTSSRAPRSSRSRTAVMTSSGDGLTSTSPSGESSSAMPVIMSGSMNSASLAPAAVPARPYSAGRPAAVTSRPSLGPDRVRAVLVAIVEENRITAVRRSRSCRTRPTAWAQAWIASEKHTVRSCGVVGTFAVQLPPASSAMKASVNVPPVSTPMLKVACVVSTTPLPVASVRREHPGPAAWVRPGRSRPLRRARQRSRRLRAGSRRGRDRCAAPGPAGPACGRSRR